MATDALEIRMARLEGAYEQINVRLGSLEREVAALRAEFKTEIVGLRSDLNSTADRMRRQMQTQFYWTLTFILGAILIPILQNVLLTR